MLKNDCFLPFPVVLCYNWQDAPRFIEEGEPDVKKTSYSANILFVVTLLFWFAQYGYTSYVNPELQRMGASAVFMGL